MRDDDFTSTVEGAAAYERQRGMDDYEPDRPDWSDVAGDDWTPRSAPMCPVTRDEDGVRTYCLLSDGHLERGLRHEPNPWTVPTDPALRQPPPF